MKEIKVHIKNCYGIDELNQTFEFKDKSTVYTIYAPNGVMKSSFAKVFDDYSKGNQSEDLIHTYKQSDVNITSENGEILDPNSVFVIHPYDRKYKSDNMSSLLINENLKRKYDLINNELEDKKKKLISELQKTSKSKQNLEKIISDHFIHDEKSFYSALIKAKTLLSPDLVDFSEIPYDSVFEERILDFLNTDDFKKDIKDYILKYDEMIDNSEYLSKDFNHYNASTIQRNLNLNGFFDAKHSLNLKNRNTIKEVSSATNFMDIIKSEKDRVLNDSELQKIFNEIDKKISNVQLRDFREFLFKNQDILVELENIDLFKEKVLLSYLNKCPILLESLCADFLSAQDEIKLIIEKANSEVTEWENVLDVFKRRFYVPFELEIKDKHEAILNKSVPTLSYNYMDKKDINEELMINVLSQGERRSLYLLNIIFEIESRRVQNLKTVFIIDDIADSFDYKNKYAIVEYLKEISENNSFRSIILTHNFDFYRTVQERIGMNKWQNSLMANKSTEGINLENVKYKYISNPFKIWKKNLNEKCKLIASITFARNICEYTGNLEDFKKLTSLLHKKKDTKDILVKDIETIYRNIFSDLTDLTLDDGEVRVYDLIFSEALKILNCTEQIGLNLENKIVLSIAIRLKAEEFMINIIDDTSFVDSITKNQTGILFDKIKKKLDLRDERVKVLDRVNIITPENIHLNSFMFEPILDMSDEHLKGLYESVNNLNK